MVATQHGPAAMFSYHDDHGSRLVVLTRPMSSADQRDGRPNRRAAMSGASPGLYGVGYSLVGHAAPESLRPIANEVRKQARVI